MRIPIEVEFFAGGLRPLTALCLKAETPKLFGFISAIIDTGSPRTILGGADVEKMRISQIQMQKLVGKEEEVNLGGVQMKTRVLPDAQLIFGNNIRIKIPVLVPVKIIHGVPPPTILGVDFLSEGKLKFFFDPSNKEAYLESPD